MSLHGMMREQFAVYQRVAEADTWTRLAVLPGWVQEMNAAGARRESKLTEPDVTHNGRFPISSYLSTGVRIRRLSDSAEWVVRVARTIASPAPGHCHLLLAEAEGATV